VLKAGDRAARPAPSPSQETQLAPGQLASLYTAEALRRRFAQGEEGGEPDLNRAADKRAFLDGRAPEAASAAYLPGGRAAPVSPYEIKAGTVIPATMVGGINSDLSGQILGQVAENIYDSATGRFILIPQGSKLVGTYDNSVTSGQRRVLVAWSRIILPDSSSIDLGRMPGTDQSGLAGLHDRVNTHFWEMFPPRSCCRISPPVCRSHRAAIRPHPAGSMRSNRSLLGSGSNSGSLARSSPAAMPASNRHWKSGPATASRSR
jgi:type IV secretory pathway VirB10-like protein